MDNTFNVTIPIEKAQSAGGKWIIHGIASDASLDMQNEITDPGGIVSLPYLQKWGKLNDDHKLPYLGEITKARVVQKSDLVKSGVLKAVPADQLKDKCLYVVCELYKGVQRAREYWDMLKSGARLGFSIQGSVLEKSSDNAVTINKRCFINQIALTGQPVNPNVWAAIKKSHSQDTILNDIAKAMTTGDSVIQPGETGSVGMMRCQSLEGAKKRKRKGLKMKKSFGGLSVREVVDQARAILNKKRGKTNDGAGSVWVSDEDVFDDFLVVSNNGAAYKYPFTVLNAKVQLGKPALVIKQWVDVTEKSLSKEALMPELVLDTPARIVKAWNDFLDPESDLRKSGADMTAIAEQIREASKVRGLEWAIDQDRDGHTTFCKSLSESDIQVLDALSEAGDDEFAEVIEKAIPPVEDEDDDEDDEDESEDGEEDEDDDDEEEEESDDDEDTRKPVKKSLAELMSESSAGEALELSPFLSEFADTVSKSLSELTDRVESIANTDEIVSQTTEAIVKSLNPLFEQVDALRTDIEILGGMPRTAKSMQPGSSVMIAEKTFGTAAQAAPLNKSHATEVLSEAVAQQLLSSGDAAAFAAEVDAGSVNPDIIKSLEARLRR